MSEFKEATIGSPASNDDLVSPAWLTDKIGKPVQNAVLQDMSGAGGMSGALLTKINITFEDQSQTALVVKQTRPGHVNSSKQLGLFREAHFFKLLSSIFPEGFLPKTYHVFGNSETGEKLLLMEDLSDTIQSGYFFGPASPLNWGKDLQLLTARAPGVTMEVIVHEVAILAARMHAKYWKKVELLEMTWLKGASWMSGQDRQAWEGSQQYVKGKWDAQKAKIGTPECETVWNSDLIAVIDASCAKLSWVDFQKRVQRGCWTLAHGDFHPANMMWRIDVDEGSSHIALLDWEVVGIGTGAQDLGQYFISHSTPESRRELETLSLRTYYAELLLCGVSAVEYSWETCQADYITGGFERWVWLLSILTDLCPPKMVQYFHDQCHAFMVDHHITPENVGQPRC